MTAAVKMPLLTMLLVAVAATSGACRAGCGVTYGYPTYSYPYQTVIQEKVIIKEVPTFFYAALAPVYDTAYVPTVPGTGHPVAPVQPTAPNTASELQQVLAAVQGVKGSIDSVKADVAELKKGQQSQDARIKALEERQGKGKPDDPFNPDGAQAQAAPAPHKGLVLMYTRCASCHEGAQAASKGGGLTLFTGTTLAPLTREVADKIKETTRGGTMPKKQKPLNHEELAAVNEFLSLLK